MKVIAHIHNNNDTQFSYEIIPPLRGKGIKIVLDMVESLKKFNPPFIDVTSHASTVSLNKHGKKTKKKKRPGTISICGIIQNRFNIDTGKGYINSFSYFYYLISDFGFALSLLLIYIFGLFCGYIQYLINYINLGAL